VKASGGYIGNGAHARRPASITIAAASVAAAITTLPTVVLVHGATTFRIGQRVMTRMDTLRIQIARRLRGSMLRLHRWQLLTPCHVVAHE